VSNDHNGNRPSSDTTVQLAWMLQDRVQKISRMDRLLLFLPKMQISLSVKYTEFAELDIKCLSMKFQGRRRRTD
jgi:hypothetical protein